MNTHLETPPGLSLTGRMLPASASPWRLPAYRSWITGAASLHVLRSAKAFWGT